MFNTDKILISYLPKPKAVRVSIDKAPAFMHPVHALFMSDIHLRRSVSDDRLNLLTEQIRQSRADILLLGGDYGEGKKQCVRFFNALKDIHFPLGAFAVPGNNDHFGNLKTIAAAGGVTLLRNDSRNIKLPGGTLCIGGCDDQKYGDPDASGLFKDDSTYRIFLSHYPIAYEDRSDLQLSGHTHGGQIVPFGITPFMIGFEHKYRLRAVKGLHKIGSRRLLVGNGIGISRLPLRINADPEFYILNFKN